ncbi:Myb-like DNA-binding domain-containing protein [Babesia ovata]|uniref:Myb-like DNA-binding domain-containing protein n=1 Tax=Babesia ovata TaxID=189622 RepID=A0A2H6KC22_9APIC|nr:Myb-like DNA-binding domain-containing protein [Babesia ovata]GBE60541.1 Myb-like DNA-binding domain-containing protein [Babesia ovata]
MELSREYAATRRPSRLRDHFVSFAQSEPSEHIQDRSGRHTTGNGYYSTQERAHRDTAKREYSRRYRSYDLEDSYAKQYDKTYIYARRAVYSHEYGEYNMRPKPASMPTTTRDNGHVSNKVNSTPEVDRENASVAHNNIVTAHRSTRRAASRWADVLADPKPSNEADDKMQLRYSYKRKPLNGSIKLQTNDSVTVDSTAHEAAATSVRVRPFSPRISTRRAASLRLAEEAKVAELSVGECVDTNNEIKATHSDVYANPGHVAVKVPDTQQTHTPGESKVEVNTVVKAEIPTTDNILPVKRKRGRPKLVRDTSMHASPTPKKERVKSAMAGSAGPVVTPVPKRTSARIRSHNAATPYSNDDHLSGDTYEEQLQKAIAMSIMEVENKPIDTDKTQDVNDDVSVHKNGKNKENGNAVLKEGVGDLDYLPSTPTTPAKKVATKIKRKYATKTTAKTEGTKSSGKVRSLRRVKEAADEAEPDTLQAKELPLPESTKEDVTVINDGAESSKMLLFEEYLDMSERMYCGKPLCVRQKQDSEENKMADTTEQDESSDDEALAIKRSASGSFSPAVEPRPCIPKNNHGNANTSDNLPDNGGSDDPFEFQCSKLDLRFRVSFAMLTSELRQAQMLDLWGPKEIVLFELGMFKHGKEFYEIQRNIPTKTVQDIVDMYYFWKKTNRYKLWKANRQY